MQPTNVKIHQREVPILAIGIARTRYENTHTGIVYRDASKRLVFFHQSFHKETKNQPFEEACSDLAGPCFCVVPPIEPERLRNIALLCETIAETGEPIGYALRDDPDARFDHETGTLVLPNGHGLSCSTFVLVIFRSAGYPLIDTSDWPKDRPGDREFQTLLVSVLEKKYPNEKEHIAAVKKEIDCARIRPEEVAGAGLYPAPNVRHRQAEGGGLFINGGLYVLGQIRK